MLPANPGRRRLIGGAVTALAGASAAGITAGAAASAADLTASNSDAELIALCRRHLTALATYNEHGGQPPAAR